MSICVEAACTCSLLHRRLPAGSQRPRDARCCRSVAGLLQHRPDGLRECWRPDVPVSHPHAHPLRYSCLLWRSENSLSKRCVTRQALILHSHMPPDTRPFCNSICSFVQVECSEMKAPRMRTFATTLAALLGCSAKKGSPMMGSPWYAAYTAAPCYALIKDYRLCSIIPVHSRGLQSAGKVTTSGHGRGFHLVHAVGSAMGEEGLDAGVPQHIILGCPCHHLQGTRLP